MNINCINNQIAIANGVLQPIILQAIKDIYLNGNHQMTARMVRNQCILIDNNKPWDGRLPAICNTIRNSIECGGIIIGEDRDFLGFTISFDGNNNLEIKTPKKTSPKVESKPKNKSNSSSIRNNTNEIEKLSLSKNFKVVLVCASGKNDSFLTAYPNKNFVNNAVQNFEHHPDEIMNNGIMSWRDYLIQNQNDQNLLSAYKLYVPRTFPFVYLDLYNKYKINFYILSAGWGLVNSEFRLPKYDITFSNTAQPKNKRNNNLIEPIYNDFYQLTVNDDEDIIFICSKDYLKLFYQLTQNLPNRKIIYHFGTALPLNIVLPNQTFLYRQYLPENPNDKRNWHYELAYKISNGIIP
jgi:hypothetical protein